jgi:teichuronic acid biosynthesis glycosyltransferase TuaC
LDALACGRPVVGCDVGGIPELLTAQTGMVVPPRDPIRLAAALEYALARQWDERLISGSFSRSWNDVARETHDVCLEAIATESNVAKTALHQNGPLGPAGVTPDTFHEGSVFNDQ